MEHSIKKSKKEMFKAIDSFTKKFLAGFKSRFASISSSQIYKRLRKEAKVSPYAINLYLRKLEETCDNKNRRWRVIGRENRRNGIRVTLKKI